jgi:hypothetical protein
VSRPASIVESKNRASLAEIASIADRNLVCEQPIERSHDGGVLSLGSIRLRLVSPAMSLLKVDGAP